MEDKTKFVKKCLAPLLKQVHCGFKDCEYRQTGYGEEYVTITYKNGYQKEICVTADSLKAIVQDVLKAV